MARDIQTYQRQLTIQGRIPRVDFGTQAVQTMEESSNMLLKQAGAMEERSTQNAYLRGQTTIAQQLNRMEMENKNDPDNLRTAIDNFSEKFLDEFADPELQARFELQLTEHGNAAVARATAGRNQIITEQGAYQTFVAMDGLQNETDQIALDYFTGDDATKATAGRRLQELMLRGQNILGQTGPDGTPFVSPAQRASFMFSLRDGTYTTMARAWMNSQPNPLTAASQWLDGNVQIQLPNEKGEMETVNMRDAMPASARAKADDAVMGLMRDRVSIQNQAMALEDRGYSKMADQVYAAAMTAAQGDPNAVGPPDPLARAKALEMLDNNRNVMIRGGKEREYFALRENLISGDPLAEDGATKMNIMVSAMNGQDPTDVGIAAVRTGRIKMETLTQAQTMYRQTQGPADNALGFYTKQFQTAYGGVNKVMDGLAAAELANGPILLATQYQKLSAPKEQGGLGRAPTIAEFEPYYRQTLMGIAARSGMNQLFDSAAMAPSFISPSLMSGPKTNESLGKLQAGVFNHFTSKFRDTNPDAWPADDAELIQAKQWLDMYSREVQAAQQPKTGGVR